MRNVIAGSFVGFVLAAAFLAACGGAGAPGDVEEMTRQVSELQASLAALRTEVTGTQAQLQQVGEDVGKCTDVLEPFSRVETDVYIVGANLHVQSGSGSTGGAVNGLGNIIIGYNELRTATDANNDRSGSHMLVVGQRHSYSGYGGIVAGDANTTSGMYASVLGGFVNSASGYTATVSGGGYNRATGWYSAVSGGHDNEAGHYSATCSGGSQLDSRWDKDHRP